MARALLPPSTGGAIARWAQRAEQRAARVTNVGAWIASSVVFFLIATLRSAPRAAAIIAAGVAIVLLAVGGLALSIVSTGTLLTELFARLSRWLRRAKVERRLAHPLAPPRPDGATARVRIRGRVKASETIEAPVSHTPCVGFRVWGSAPGSEIDDAAFVTFDVVDHEGTLVRVAGSAASIALDIDDDPPLVRPDDVLADFLDDRAGLVSLGPVRLGEAVLVDGDEVIVEGVETTAAVADGYRGSRAERVIVERPGAPLVIRKPRA